MRKMEILEWLRQRPISEPVAGALEELTIGGVPSEAVEELERFRQSPLVENRLAAASILANYCELRDLEADGVALLARGFVSGDSDIYFGGLGILGRMADLGSDRARQIIDALRRDAVLAKALLFEPYAEPSKSVEPDHSSDRQAKDVGVRAWASATPSAQRYDRIENDVELGATMSIQGGYERARRVIERLYEVSGIDEFAILLGAMAVKESDGLPMDPAMYEDWEIACRGAEGFSAVLGLLHMYSSRFGTAPEDFSRAMSDLEMQTSDLRVEAEKVWNART